MSDFPEPLDGDMAHRRAQVEAGDIHKVQATVAKLNPLDDEHWNPIGMPQLSIVRNMTSLPTLSRAELTDFTDGYNREAAAKKHKVQWSPDPVEPDYDDGGGLDDALPETPMASVTPDALKDMVKDVVKEALHELMTEAGADDGPGQKPEVAKAEGANDNGQGDGSSDEGKPPEEKANAKPAPKNKPVPRPKNAPKNKPVPRPKNAPK